MNLGPQRTIHSLKFSPVCHAYVPPGLKEGFFPGANKAPLTPFSKEIRESLLLQLALLLAPRRRRLKPVVYVVERDRQPCQNDASFASLAEDVWHDVPAADIKRHKWCFQQLTEIHLLLPHLLHRLLELILHTRVRDGRDSRKSHRFIIKGITLFKVGRKKTLLPSPLPSPPLSRPSLLPTVLCSPLPSLPPSPLLSHSIAGVVK